MNLRIAWFWLSLLVFLISIASLPTIPMNVWRTLTLGQQLSMICQTLLSGTNVAVAYWLYTDRRDIDKKK